MITLAIETSTAHGSVALLDGEIILYNESFAAERGCTSQLFLTLERALAVAPACAQIAVGLGPGSYSGVRIAISAAIGLSIGSGAKLVGLPSILALDSDAPRYRAVGDARRASFYFAEIENRECVAGSQLLTREELVARLDDSCPVFASAPLPDFPSVQFAIPTAENLARLAAAGRGIIARDQLEPLYLRAPHITVPRVASSAAPARGG